MENQRDVPSGPAPCSGHPLHTTPAGRRLGLFMRFVWLGYLAFPLTAMASAHHSALHLALCSAATAVAVGCYVALLAYVEPGRFPSRTILTYTALGLLGAISVGLALYDGLGWLALLVYLVAAAGFRLSGGQFLVTLVAVTAAAVLILVHAGSSAGTVASSVGGIAAVGIMMAAWRRILLSNRALALAQEEVAHLAVAEERLRFARDLHDLLGHSLSVIAIKAELAGRLAGSAPERARAEVGDIEAVARDALREVREVVSGYRQPVLGAEIGSARSALMAAGIEPILTREGPDLPEEADSVLAWAVREGVTNVVRHSRARHCWLTISAGRDGARVTFADDGVGLDGGDLRVGPGGQAQGHGLRGLRERVAGAGGHLRIGTSGQGGFLLDVEVPLPPAGPEPVPAGNGAAQAVGPSLTAVTWPA